VAKPMSWTHIFRMNEAAPTTRALVPDEAERREIARTLGLMALERLEASVSVEPWFDGLQITGRWDADVAQACSVTLERLDSQLSGVFLVRAVPPESVHAAPETVEAILDLEADDPPDIIEGGAIDLAAYVIEHLALEIDPFPRKPGAEFAPPDGPRESSPFDVLKGLKGE